MCGAAITSQNVRVSRGEVKYFVDSCGQLIRSKQRHLNLTLLGLARTIYIRCPYGIFGLEITKYTVYIYVYIRFWPTLYIAHAHARTCAHAQQRHARADVHTHMHTQAVQCVHKINLLSVSTHTTHVHTRMHIQAYTHTHAHAYVHTHIHVQAVECVHQINLLSVSTHTTHVHTRMHIQAHTHTHAHAYVHTLIHVQAVKRFDIHNCVFVSMHSACTHGHTPHAYALCIHTCTHRI